jgi:hypothetical protein
LAPSSQNSFNRYIIETIKIYAKECISYESRIEQVLISANDNENGNKKLLFRDNKFINLELSLLSRMILDKLKKDPLQKRLGEMEELSPSPSLDTKMPKLHEIILFFGRNLFGTVNQIPQKDYASGEYIDIIQKRLGEMEELSPSPSLENDGHMENWTVLLSESYFKRKIEEVPQRDLINHKTLGDVFYDSKVWWINHDARRIAEEEGKDIELDHYKKAVKQDDYLMINEFDTSLQNLYNSLRMIANKGEYEGSYDKILLGQSHDAKDFLVHETIKIGGNIVRVVFGDINFSISPKGYDSGLYYSGDKVPSDILTQLLNGKVHEEKMAEIKRKRNHNSSGFSCRSHSRGGSCNINPRYDNQQEFWAKLFPGSIRAAEYRDNLEYYRQLGK